MTIHAVQGQGKPSAFIGSLLSILEHFGGEASDDKVKATSGVVKEKRVGYKNWFLVSREGRKKSYIKLNVH